MWSITTRMWTPSSSTAWTSRSVPLTAETLAATDVVVVVTDHAKVDYGLVVEESSLILDTRNALKAFDDEKVVRL